MIKAIYNNTLDTFRKNVRANATSNLLRFETMRNRAISASAFILIVTLFYTPKADANVSRSSLFDQSTHLLAAFPPPKTVQSGTTVMIDGSDSLVGSNTVLEQSFENQFPGTNIEINYSGTDVALVALQQGQIDLAAIDRPLTPEERAQNLVAVPMGQQNIAVVVGAGNLLEDLAVKQFIAILQGEIVDWAELGSAPARIRVIQRSPSNPARQALQRYSIFDNAFEAGDHTVELSDDRTESLIKALENDGISFAMADQVMGQPGVRVLSIHGTLPRDLNYPFSSPLAYVYQGPNPSSVVQAYLGYATTPESQRAIAAKAYKNVSRPEALNSEAVEAKPGSASASEKSPKAEQTERSFQDKPTDSETKKDPSLSKSKTPLASDHLLPWWRWTAVASVVASISGILLWSLFSNNLIETNETDSEDSIETNETDLEDSDDETHITLPPQTNTAYRYRSSDELYKQRHSR
jgi:phosphate transport system substrate-binding protein